MFECVVMSMSFLCVSCVWFVCGWCVVAFVELFLALFGVCCLFSYGLICLGLGCVYVCGLNVCVAFVFLLFCFSDCWLVLCMCCFVVVFVVCVYFVCNVC